jgi:hypothetical protein
MADSKFKSDEFITFVRSKKRYSDHEIVIEYIKIGNTVVKFASFNVLHPLYAKYKNVIDHLLNKNNVIGDDQPRIGHLSDIILGILSDESCNTIVCLQEFPREWLKYFKFATHYCVTSFPGKNGNDDILVTFIPKKFAKIINNFQVNKTTTYNTQKGLNNERGQKKILETPIIVNGIDIMIVNTHVPFTQFKQIEAHMTTLMANFSDDSYVFGDFNSGKKMDIVGCVVTNLNDEFTTIDTRGVPRVLDNIVHVSKK